MQVEWDPEDGSVKQEWTFDPGDVDRKSAILIEKHFGGSWDQFLAGLMLGQIQARAALLWYMMYLVHDKVRFEDIPNFRVRQLKVYQGVTELKDLWKRVQRMKLPEDQMDAFTAQFEEDMKDAMVREGLDPDNLHIDGKQLAIEGPGADLPKQA